MNASTLTTNQGLDAGAPQHTSEHGALPLAPLDRPQSWFARLLFAASRRRYGMVPTAFRVLYARTPYLGFVSLVLYYGLGRAVALPGELGMLLQLFVATDNGCTFCADLALAELVRQRVGTERFRELTSFETSTHFSAREKAALAYARALQQSLHVPDAVWSELAAHFDERERVAIVWTCAVERYFNGMAVPLRIGSDGLAAGALRP